MRKTIALALICLATPLAAKDSLGVFSDWGAFRDPSVPRCYAIAVATDSKAKREFDPFASVGTWPRRQLRGQVHFRLSRQIADKAAVTLILGRKSFRLTGGGADAWAQDRTMDAAILAGMRSTPRMTIRSTDRSGRRFTDTYSLAGAASAIDAATLGCARLK
ncbi:hypothetical protein [Qipengyuania soli]|uniref:Mlr4354 like protein n=1 Tax=Qipengyuania soli TaxID=2782568 RepID=A0A7S8F267_9SPHN|nr:hypothetical protein [Qipengyuania soli]QPC97751.1 hypothetical protein IRL76_07475 [Qipengyuania soli]